MILYPTETIYALGVNALDDDKLKQLFLLKVRDERQAVSWLVRNIADVAEYAEISDIATKIATRFLPGPLTLVLPAKNTVPSSRSAPDGTIGFRISLDPIAKQVIAEFMKTYGAPLTCTSANISGMPTLSTVSAIQQQFGDRVSKITTVIDRGIRQGAASTVVRVIGDKVEVLREGTISAQSIFEIYI